MQLKGIKQGNQINLLQEINFDDGQEITLNISSPMINHKERYEKIKQFLESSWEGKEDFIETMERLEQEKNEEWEKLYGEFNR